MKKNKILLSAVLVTSTILLTTACGNVKLKNGENVAIKINSSNITSDALYKVLKTKYGKNVIVNQIDKEIFNTIYKDDKDIENSF